MGWKAGIESEAGQTMAEYAVVLGVITPTLVLALTLFGNRILDEISKVKDLIP